MLTTVQWFVVITGVTGILIVSVCMLAFIFWLLFHERDVGFGMCMLGLCLIGLAYAVGSMFC